MAESFPNIETISVEPLDAYAWAAGFAAAEAANQEVLNMDWVIGEEDEDVFTTTSVKLSYFADPFVREEVAKLFDTEDQLVAVEAALATAHTIADQLGMVASLPQRHKAGIVELASRKYEYLYQEPER